MPSRFLRRQNRGVVEVSSSLLVRTNPSPSAEVVDKLQNGALVYVLDKNTPTKYTISGATGYYWHIEYGTATGTQKFGYAFGPYIRVENSVPVWLIVFGVLAICAVGIFFVVKKNKRFFALFAKRVSKRIKELRKKKTLTKQTAKRKKITPKVEDELKWYTVRTPMVVKLLFASLFFIILSITVMLNMPFLANTFEKKFFPPDPVVVSSEGNDLSSSLLEYSEQLIVNVRNDGGDGVVLFEATMIQDGKRYTKTTTQYFAARETKTMKIVFDEAELLSGPGTFEYRVSAFSK